jgi:nucleosome assembly protein 1-like 1
MSSKNDDDFAPSDLPAAAAALSAEDRADLVNALKNKLQSLAGQHDDILETLSPKVKKRVEVLQEIQNQHDELKAKYFEEKTALEAKYEKLYQPLYTKRYEIVNGVVEVEGITNEVQEGEKGVPDFWLTAIKNNDIVSEEVTERDEGALKFLKDIKWLRLEDPKGFKLEFHFDPNPYFQNSILTKTYYVVDDDGDPLLEKAVGTEIEWVPGKCLTQKVLKKKPKKGVKNTKTIVKTEKCESFFNFFTPPKLPEKVDVDEDMADEFQDLMEHDYNLGVTIRDKIIHHAVSWFMGDQEYDDDDEESDDEEAS